MSLLDIQDLSFAYGEKTIFQHINYSLEPGQICCLMGPNGCGKSTLMDCILGDHAPKTGQILLEGKNIRDYKPKELATLLSYVPQVHERTFPYTVRQVVQMGRTPYCRFYGGVNEEDETIVDEALDLVDLLPLADQPYTQISGGEMQLTLLARAVVQDTPLILMDEPTAHLDFRNELIFLQMVVRLMEEKQKAVFLATHSPNHAFYFENQNADVTVAAMSRDRSRHDLLSVGRPREVLTEENIKEIYGIRAKRMSHTDETFGTLTQIVPVCTCGSGKGKGRGAKLR